MYSEEPFFMLLMLNSCCQLTAKKQLHDQGSLNTSTAEGLQSYFSYMPSQERMLIIPQEFMQTPKKQTIHGKQYKVGNLIYQLVTLPMAQGLTSSFNLDDPFQPKPFFDSTNCSTVVHHMKEAAVSNTQQHYPTHKATINSNAFKQFQTGKRSRIFPV